MMFRVDLRRRDGRGVCERITILWSDTSYCLFFDGAKSVDTEMLDLGIENYLRVFYTRIIYYLGRSL